MEIALTKNILSKLGHFLCTKMCYDFFFCSLNLTKTVHKDPEESYLKISKIYVQLKSKKWLEN